MDYKNMKEDLTEIKTDVKEIRSMIHTTITDHAVLKQRVDALSGKIGIIFAVIGTVLTSLAYSIWGWIKIKFGIH